MISKEKIHSIALEYLRKKQRSFLELSKPEEVRLREDHEILYGDRAGERTDLFIVEYTVQVGLSEEGVLIYIDAYTGEVLYSMSATSWIEDIERSNE
ncbi:hypothetical protein [Halocola ammonii]